MSLLTPPREAMPWIPRNALDDGVLTNLLRQYCEDWSRLWFTAARPNVRMSSRSISKARFDRNALAWRSACSRLFLLVEPDSANLLALSLVGLDKPAKPPKADDQALLHDLARGCLDNLSGLLERNLQITCSRAEHDGLQTFEKAIAFEITLIERLKVEIFIEHNVAMQWRKRAMAPARASGALSDRRTAISPTEVLLSLHLGSSTIPLTDLNALSVGDIIVTETEFETRLPLCINGRVNESRNCAVKQGTRGLEFHL